MAKARILIADEHFIIRRGLRVLLEAQAGWEVCGEAATGREAVEHVGRLKPDVAIMGILMPGLNGFEATRQIVKAAPRTEVLIFTKMEGSEVVRQAWNAGARGFVLKSDTDARVVEAVEALTMHKAYISPSVADFLLHLHMEAAGSVNGDRLTPREREVVQLLAEGKSNKGVAACLGIAVKTAEAHRANVMRKLNLDSLAQLVRYAIRNNMLTA